MENFYFAAATAFLVLEPANEVLRKRDALARAEEEKRLRSFVEDSSDVGGCFRGKDVVCFFLVVIDAVLRSGGALRDVAPTVLDLLDVPQPAEMSGQSLLLDRRVPDGRNG